MPTNKLPSTSLRNSPASGEKFTDDQSQDMLCRLSANTDLLFYSVFFSGPLNHLQSIHPQVLIKHPVCGDHSGAGGGKLGEREFIQKKKNDFFLPGFASTLHMLDTAAKKITETALPGRVEDVL